MNVGQLTPRDLEARLSGPGLRVVTGPVVTEIHSPLPAVRAGIALHYAAHPVAGDDAFADFHVHVERPHNLRRLIRPQVIFRFEFDPPFKPLPGDQAFPILEWGLNWCVSTHCHQFVMIHAAIVERGGRALILPAPPGSGKSTLCAGLVARGWRLLSDEQTLIDPATGRLLPIPRPISLKNASIDVIGRFWPGAAFGPTVHDTMKGSVAHLRPPEDSVRRAFEPAAPGMIVLPKFEAGAPLAIEPMRRGEAFMRLADNAFNYTLHGRAGFDTLGGLVAASDAYALTYGGQLDEAVAALERHMDRR